MANETEMKEIIDYVINSSVEAQQDRELEAEILKVLKTNLQNHRRTTFDELYAALPASLLPHSPEVAKEKLDEVLSHLLGYAPNWPGRPKKDEEKILTGSAAPQE